MADSKISALPASTTPLAGTEVLPIVQSSTTRQVSVANLTAGRAISATQLTLSTGNLIVANGQGVDFSATPGTGTSELLADYEEGTWTPQIAGDGTAGTYTNATAYGNYTKIGNCVTLNFGVASLSAASGGTGSLTVTGLPFTKSASQSANGTCWINNINTAIGTISLAVGFGSAASASSTLYIYESKNIGTVTNTAISGVSTSSQVHGQITYYV